MTTGASSPETANMETSQSPQQVSSSSLKRKASTELPADKDRTTGILEEAYSPYGDHVASVYNKTYKETVAEIKKLLKEYSLAARGVSGDKNADHVAGEYHNDAKNELQAILNDLSSRPELIEMAEMKEILHDCGIDIQCRHTGTGGHFLEVQFKTGN